LGSSDAEDIQKNVNKLFMAKKLIFGSGKVIKGMIDPAGESFDFYDNLKPEG